MGNTSSGDSANAPKKNKKKKTKPVHTTLTRFPAVKRAIFMLISKQTAFLGRNTYLMILSFLRKFSLKELSSRLPEITSKREYVIDAAGNRTYANLDFLWRSIDKKIRKDEKSIVPQLKLHHGSSMEHRATISGPGRAVLAGDTLLDAGLWYWEVRVDKDEDCMWIGVAKANSQSNMLKALPYIDRRNRTLVALYNCHKPARAERYVHVPGLWGRAYWQGGTDGVASYHFNSPQDCYISYSNAPASWILSDGSRPPAKKPFEEVSYDSSTRTFRAVINWAPLNFFGETRWEYEMTFCQDWKQIKGRYLSLPSKSVMRYGHDLHYRPGNRRLATVHRGVNLRHSLYFHEKGNFQTSTVGVLLDVTGRTIWFLVDGRVVSQVTDLDPGPFTPICIVDGDTRKIYSSTTLSLTRALRLRLGVQSLGHNDSLKDLST